MIQYESIISDYINNHYSSDIVKLNKESDISLQEWWMGSIGLEKGLSEKTEDMHYVSSIPSDLILGETVPIMDVAIDVYEEATIGRVIIFNSEDYISIQDEDVINRYQNEMKETIKDTNMHIEPPHDNSKLNIVGVVGTKARNNGKFGIYRMYDEIYIPICAFDGFDLLFVIPDIIVAYGGKQYTSALKEFALTFGTDPVVVTSVSYLLTWYGIQLSMLHPVVKEIYANGQRLKRRSVDPFIDKKSIKQPTKYIKRHVIIDENFVETAYKDAGYTYERKTMLWWVSGHWHTYGKNKEKKFVKGYWKGPLRITGKLDTPRERDVNRE